jgi:acid ceramidase/N-acylethanolamine-hydrolysing acid amidase
MKQNEHIVNLDLPATERWHFLVDYKKEVNDLLQCYLNDFEGTDLFLKGLVPIKKILFY